MCKRVKQYYYWKDMSRDIFKNVNNYVLIMHLCKARVLGEHHSIPVGGSFECVGMSFVEFDKNVASKFHNCQHQGATPKQMDLWSISTGFETDAL